ncbi:MAG: signal peptidase II [Actinomycetota bacterium]
MGERWWTSRGNRLLVIGVVLVIADLFTKWLAVRLPDVPGVDPHINDELALGVFSGDSHPLVLVALGIGVVVVLGHLWWLRPKTHLADVALMLVVAGALANAIDRLVTGGVHDFIDLGFAIANLADFWLLGGLLIYIWLGMRYVPGDDDRAD